MIRRLFTFVSVSSLLLCVTTALLTYLGHRDNLSFEFRRNGVRWEIACRDAHLLIGNSPQVMREDSELRQYVEEQFELNDDATADREWRRSHRALIAAHEIRQAAHVEAMHKLIASPTTPCRYAIPSALAIVGLLVLPCLRLVTSWRAYKLRVGGFCGHCGYDLRASKERCPECGMAIPLQAKSPA